MGEKKNHSIDSLFFRPYHHLLPLFFLFPLYFQASIMNGGWNNSENNISSLFFFLDSLLEKNLKITLKSFSSC